jgi:hypothetical protein
VALLADYVPAWQRKGRLFSNPILSDKENMMQRSHLVLGIMLATSLVATGCGGKVRLASQKSCQAHGGTYDASAHACTVGGSTKSAQSICQAEGGYYDPSADVCEMGME